MPIDYFENRCESSSNITRFGICDDPPPASNPAYIDEENTTHWIAKVLNPNKRNCTFHAIDNCVTILKANGKMESRCDGLMKYDSTLIFIELKSREGGQW